MDEQTSEPAQVIRLLLVEDHLLTRIGLKTVIERRPEFKVIGEAENGEVAIRRAQELRPDVILMDVGMPVMDGIEAARLIKQKLVNVEIVMLTSHDNERDILASLAAGAAGYCLKHVEPDRLYSAIQSVNAGDVWLDSSIASKVLKAYNGGASGSLSSTPRQTASTTSQSANSTTATEFSTPIGEPLSPRELEVLTLVVDGLSNQGIADKLFISLATAKTHVRNILNKLSVDDRTQAAVQAMRRGLV